MLILVIRTFSKNSPAKYKSTKYKKLPILGSAINVADPASWLAGQGILMKGYDIVGYLTCKMVRFFFFTLFL